MPARAQRSAGGPPVGCGKLDVSGAQVLEMYRAGNVGEINDYCLCDTIDTELGASSTDSVTREAAVTSSV